MKTKLISLMLLFVCFVVAQHREMMRATDKQERVSKNLSGIENTEQKPIRTPENLCPECLETTLGIEVHPEGNPGTSLSKFPGKTISVSYSHEGCFQYQEPYYFERAHFEITTHPTLVNVTDESIVYPLYENNNPIGQDPHTREWTQSIEWETSCWDNPLGDEFTIPCDIIPGEYKLKIKFIMSGAQGVFIYDYYPFSVDVTCTDGSGTLLTYQYNANADVVVEHEMENLRTVIILENNSPVFENPIINCGTTLEVQIGEMVAFDVVASDEDVADEVTLWSGVLPSGAVLTPEFPGTGNSATSTFSWTPLSGQAGDHSISFSAQDNANCPNTTTCTITIRVLPPPPPLNVCIIKYFDENHNQSLEPTETVMENVDFEMVKDDVPFTHYSGSTNSEGKLCFNHLEPGTYFIREFLPDGYTYSTPLTGTMAITLPGDEGDIIWLNQVATNNNYYRTATYMDWATGGMNPRVKKSEKCKAKTVQFKFVLQIPSDVDGIKLSFTNMKSSGIIYKGTTKQEVLNTWTDSKSAVYFGVLTPGEYIQIDGIGNLGKAVKVDYEWHSLSADKYLTKSTVETFLEHRTLLPMPNLHNVGEQLFAQEAFSAGLKIGTKKMTNGAHSVNHAKYNAVQKSLFDRDVFHTGTPQCLSMINRGKEYFSKQLRYLGSS